MTARPGASGAPGRRDDEAAAALAGSDAAPAAERRPVTGPGAEIASGDAAPGAGELLVYGLAGMVFGFILVKSEVVSWFRIQEMFRFQSFHMYGIFASALAVATPLLVLIRRAGLRSVGGEPIEFPDKKLGSGRRYVAGGGIFGVGWAFTGACPGPLFALVGGGVWVYSVAILAAIAGVWTYGHVRPKLPH